MARRPPRGYTQDQHPLPHDFKYFVPIDLEAAAENSFMFTLIRASDACLVADSTVVNPQHPSFAGEAGATCCMGSIVPRLNVSMDLWLDKVARETDKVRAVRVNYMPVYIAFLDNLTAKDEKSGAEIEDVLELQHDVGNRDTFPLFSTTDGTTGTTSQPFSNVNDADEAFGDYGLGGTGTLESVAFDRDLFWDAMHFHSTRNMLKTVTGGMRTAVVTPDRPFHFGSANFTHPKVKRMNPYTYCGLLVHIELSGSNNQILTAAETSANNWVNCIINCRYDEWNPNFVQSMQ